MNKSLTEDDNNVKDYKNYELSVFLNSTEIEKVTKDKNSIL